MALTDVVTTLTRDEDWSSVSRASIAMSQEIR